MLLGAFRAQPWLVVLAVLTVVLSAGSVLVYYERAFHGPVRRPAVDAVRDLRPPEAVAAVVLGAVIVVFGFFPGVLLDTSRESVQVLVDRLERPAGVLAEGD